MNNYELEKNMILYCKNGETVVLVTFTDRNIWVKYKGEIYLRPITTINKTLFLRNPLLKKLFQNNEEIGLFDLSDKKQTRSETRVNSITTATVVEPKPKQADTTERKSCMNCRHQLSGECSSWDVCEDYQPVYVVADSEKNYWPTYGDATLFRRKSRKK